MAKDSPTVKENRLLVRLGYQVGITEKWNPHAGGIDPETGAPRGIRQDLYGFVDLVAHKCGSCPVYLQVTSWSNVQARVMKIVTECQKEAVPLVGSRCAQVEVWGFKPGRVPRNQDNLKRVRMRLDERQGAVLPDAPCTMNSLDLK